MTHFSRQTDPDTNFNFCRDWGAGPVHIKLRSEKPDPASLTTKTESAEVAKPEASA